MYTRENVLQKVKENIAQEFGENENDIKEDSNISKDFTADSLDKVALVMALERDFNIAIPDAEAEVHFDNKTVSEIVDYIMKKVN